MDNFFQEINFWYSIISSAVLGLAGYFGGRKLKEIQLKKEEKEVQNSSISVHENNIKLYQTLLDDLEIRFKSRITILENDVSRMIKLNEEANSIIDKQEKYIKSKSKYILKLEKTLDLNNIKYVKESTINENP